MYRAKGHFGSVALRLGRRELGHLHGDAVADVPLPPKLRDQQVKAGAVEGDASWATVPLETEESVRQALALLRANYDRGQANRSLGRLKGQA